MGSTKILSEEAFKAKFWSRVDTGNISQCWTWKGTQRTKKGYGQIGHNDQYILAHRVAYTLLKGEIPKGLCVLHKCDNPRCCNPEHLFLGTYQDNCKDMFNKGRGPSHKGERNGRAILTESKVMRIRKEAKHNRYKTLAKKYGISTVTIAKIIQGKLWRHVTDALKA